MRLLYRVKPVRRDEMLILASPPPTGGLCRYKVDFAQIADALDEVGCFSALAIDSHRLALALAANRLPLSTLALSPPFPHHPHPHPQQQVDDDEFMSDDDDY